jgi:hypothetical protein
MRSIKILLLILTFFTLLFTFDVPSPAAENPVQIHFFYDKVCVHCQLEKVELQRLETIYSFLTVQYYEITDFPENNALFGQVKAAFNNESPLTPYTVIGGVALLGYNDQVQANIEKLITRYSRTPHIDVVQKIIDGIPLLESDFGSLEFESGDFVYLPIIGGVLIDELSLFFAAVVIGIVDGFNPCAMWVLIFLITMLINSKNKKRMWLLGITFLVASAGVYFLFMVAWLNIAISIVAISWIRILIGLFALGFGSWSVSKFIKERKNKDIGCEVTTSSQKKKLMDRIKHIVTEKNGFIAFGGIILLAGSVNLIELACSAGLPLLFTQILAYNQLEMGTYYFYILIYILFFLLDDLIVFSIAMISLRVTGITTRYQKYSHLIGGIIMIFIALLLIFFPNLLSFQF